MEITDQIFTIDSGKAGPTVMVIAGVHGNERAGVYALQELVPRLELTRGKLFVAFGNPAAINANVRMLTKNLNRCFYAGNNGTDPEDKRARQLMKYMDKAEALLDLHMFYDDDGVPFVICEETCLDMAKFFDVEIISTNWAETEPGGSDDYMYKQGKVGICVECGPISRSKEYTGFAIKTTLQFLKYYGMVKVDIKLSSKTKKIIKTYKTVYRTNQDYRLTPGLKNFQELPEGKLILRDGDKEYFAEAGDCVIFPHYKARIGEEAYVLGKIQPVGEQQV